MQKGSLWYEKLSTLYRESRSCIRRIELYSKKGIEDEELEKDITEQINKTTESFETIKTRYTEIFE